MMLGACTPILRIFDERKARDHYVDWLGFRVDFEHRFDANAPLYLGISRGDCKLHLSEHHGDGTPGTFVRVPCDDLDAYCAQLNGVGYKYYRPGIQVMEWGTREMTTQDGFGNRVIFFDEKLPK
jgi:uncharacterized glyoxalase superfamily protein PhnB